MYFTSLKSGKSKGIFLYDGNNFFCQTSKMGQIQQKIFFSSKWATYSLSKLFLLNEAFSWILTKNFTFGSKMRLTQNEAKNYSESYLFSTCLKRGKYSGKVIWLKQHFMVNRETGHILMKTFFLLKMSLIQLSFSAV